MSEKIDYDAYLKQLGDIDTNQKNRLKAYLEEQCKHDDALRACYKPEKMDDCYEFFKKCFEKAARESGEDAACIEDAVGYKIARDYFIEILPNLKDEKSEKKADEKSAEPPAEEKPVDITPAVETVKEVAQQIEKDATSDNVKRDEYGFEVFGEEADEPEEAEEETVEESCDQVKEEVEEAAEDVFFSGQAFNAGDIIDRHGRRLLFCELKEGMRFILENKLNEDFYSVGVIKKVYEDKIIYDSYKEKLSAYKRYIDDDFPCIDNEPGGWCFSVPKDALILGWQKDNGGEMYGEPRVPVTDYDPEGNGLLFGF